MDVTPSCKNSLRLQVRTGARHFAAAWVSRTWRERHHRDCRETTIAVIHSGARRCKGSRRRREMTNDEILMSKEARNPKSTSGFQPDSGASRGNQTTLDV